MTDFVTRTFDRLENGILGFEARLGEVRAENYLWALVVGLLAGLPNGCFAILAIIQTGATPSFFIKVDLWLAAIFLIFSTPFLQFYTKSWWKSLRSGASLAFGSFTGISTPILIFWFFQPGVEKIQILGAVATLMAICLWLLEGTNPRLDKPESSDWHHVGPSV